MWAVCDGVILRVAVGVVKSLASNCTEMSAASECKAKCRLDTASRQHDMHALGPGFLYVKRLAKVVLESYIYYWYTEV